MPHFKVQREAIVQKSADEVWTIFSKFSGQSGHLMVIHSEIKQPLHKNLAQKVSTFKWLQLFQQGFAVFEKCFSFIICFLFRFCWLGIYKVYYKGLLIFTGSTAIAITFNQMEMNWSFSILKYGFCNKSFRKDEPLTSSKKCSTGQRFIVRKWLVTKSIL